MISPPSRPVSLVCSPLPDSSVTPAILDVVVLCLNEPSEAERNAHNIATFLGADARLVVVNPRQLYNAERISELVPKSICLITAAETLAHVQDSSNARGVFFDLNDVLAAHSLIYGFRPVERHRTLLRLLSSGRLVDLAVPRAGATDLFEVSDRSRPWSGPFTGLSLEATSSGEYAFVEAPGSDAHKLIRIDGKPFLVRMERDDRELIFLGCREFANLDERVHRHARPIPWFPRLIPLMMFFRSALGTRLWHNENPRACLIIDDPVFKNRYGFLEYDRLVESMHRRRYATSIAFIPLNYRRSRRDVAAFVTSSADSHLSVSVHGCDHTDSEFASTDFTTLHSKAHTALDRMGAHQRLSGIPFDDVMIFPQGRFSAEAVAAAKACNYLATINGDIAPANSGESPTLRNWLEVAVTDFGGFPLFGRRYPREITEFAFDLFVGKPALAVEHHGYFKSGYGEVESFVDRLNSLDPRLEWASLGVICSRASLTRMADDACVDVRFYTNRFRLQNPDRDPRRYRLFTRKPTNESITLKVNESEYDFEHRGDDLTFAVDLEAGATVDVRLQPMRHDHPHWRPSNIHWARVRARRVLGEFRDDYVDTTRSFVDRLVRTPFGQRTKEPMVSEAGGTMNPMTPAHLRYMSETSARTIFDAPPAYVLITPVRNEAAFIELTLRSVIAQTIRPLRWIIVNDGSTDGTDGIVQKYLADHQWIELVNMPERKQRSFAGKVAAFNEGYSRVGDLDFEVVGNLDADVSFEPDYLEFLVEKFGKSPQLGIAGTPYQEEQAMYDDRFKSPEHVSGACQLFRRTCFEGIGGYPAVASGGIDFIAVLKAQAAGWETRRFDEKVCQHHKNVGSGTHAPIYRRLFNHGRKDYLLGSHPVFELFRGAFQMRRKPYVIGGTVMLCGYYWTMIRRVNRSMPNELVAIRQRDQLKRLRYVLRHPRISRNGLNNVATQSAPPTR
jgi:poly-beta-1,6-N-acetyl-D-glucosamine synthase